MIETLDEANHAEIVEVIAEAFRTHPLIPPEQAARRSRLMAGSVLKAFADAPDARVFGIRSSQALECVAFVYDAAYEPRGLKLIRFLFQMIRVVGWRMSRMFARLMADKPKAEERQLELMILGTRTESQGKGLGRAMLRHIYEYARQKSYQSVVLEVARETPAYGLYLREGFVVEKEIDLPNAPMCFVRRPIACRED